ncbi:UDP-N-acetylglucosamine--N-acetylmuramyl-(pentapeptide) pyrophosphoryl-undecaprenol N-acetylglucosamine transferase, partial [bacterium]|nr:UDP-N-acetylglucosamine--N-acetylmuramyl-(pentapeptide) pyrophosphoryl-undecaprenol N-acetylglucosamine transferase [bacterium]
MKQKAICFVAGKSGGHIIPALTLAKNERKKKTASSILFFSTSSALDNQLTTNKSIITWHVPLNLENIPFLQPWKLPIFSWHFTKAFFSALVWLNKKKPEKVVSTGGYIALPVCLAAKILRIPIELWELNVQPGKTTKFLAPLANTINICFEQTKQFLPQKKCIMCEYPIKYENIKTEQTRKECLKKLSLDEHKKTILILGGSQGSLFINNLIKEWIQKNKSLKKTVQLIHQTGAIDKTDWKTFYKTIGINAIVADFFNDLQKYYQAADIVVCRSGAGSLF